MPVPAALTATARWLRADAPSATLSALAQGGRGRASQHSGTTGAAAMPVRPARRTCASSSAISSPSRILMVRPRVWPLCWRSWKDCPGWQGPAWAHGPTAWTKKKWRSWPLAGAGRAVLPRQYAQAHQSRTPRGRYRTRRASGGASRRTRLPAPHGRTARRERRGFS